MSSLPLVVIAGPTASGKTRLAIDIAKRFNGEIISADSRAIYKGMDIGSAKPTMTEREGIPHWGFDLIEPGQRFTAYDFKHFADSKIQDIRSRGCLPILVGGTGLYVDAVIFNFQFNSVNIDEDFHQMLESMQLEDLHKYCDKNNIILPENSKNKRYVINAIERKNISAKGRKAPIENTIIVGIATDRDVLRNRIIQRSEQIFTDGVVGEATRLGEKYGWDNEAMTGNIYPLIHRHLLGILTLSEVKESFVTLDWRLAKRQLTWLKRNPFIHWGSLDELRSYLDERLAKS